MRTAKSLAVTALLVLAGTGLAATGPAAASATAQPEPVGSGVSDGVAAYHFHSVWATRTDCVNRANYGVRRGEWSNWLCTDDGLHSPVYEWSLYV